MGRRYRPRAAKSTAEWDKGVQVEFAFHLLSLMFGTLFTPSASVRGQLSEHRPTGMGDAAWTAT
jgi:hypothetical protein